MQTYDYLKLPSNILNSPVTFGIPCRAFLELPARRLLPENDQNAHRRKEITIGKISGMDGPRMPVAVESPVSMRALLAGARRKQAALLELTRSLVLAESPSDDKAAV